MNVEGAARRRLEYVLRQEEPIGHDHGGIGADGAEAFRFLWAFQRFGREHRETRLLRGLFPRDFFHGEIWRSHEDDAHRRALWFAIPWRGGAASHLYHSSR